MWEKAHNEKMVAYMKASNQAMSDMLSADKPKPPQNVVEAASYLYGALTAASGKEPVYERCVGIVEHILSKFGHDELDA